MRRRRPISWSPPGKPGAPLRRPSTRPSASLRTTPRSVGGDIPSEGPPAKAGARVEGSFVRSLNAYAPSLLSAGLLALSFYPTRVEWLVWVALVPLLTWLARPGRTSRQAIVGCGFVGAFYHLYVMTPLFSLSWWVWGTTTQEGLRAYLSYQTLFLLVLLSVVALWSGAVMALVGLVMRRHLGRPVLALWWVPAAWVFLLEYVGHASVFGFSWGLLGNRLHDATHLRQVASLTGIYGLSFLIVLVNAAIALAIGRVIRVLDAAPSPRSLTSVCALALCHPPMPLVLLMGGGALLAALGYGLAVVPRSTTTAPALHVALLQPGATPGRSPVFTEDGLDLAAARLLDEAASVPADLLVLPENIWFRTLKLDDSATPLDRAGLSPTAVSTALEPYLSPRGRIMAFGVDAVQNGRIYNATAFWTSDGVAGTYFKRRLVPFAEYQPSVVGRWAPQNRLRGPRFAYQQGRGSQLVRAQGLVLGAFICQEVEVPGLVRQSVRDGAQLLVTTGNDRVFASPIVAWEHANLAQLRALEHRRFVLRAMKGGVTSLIDPWGRVVAKAPLDADAFVRGTVQPRSDHTLYTRLGDWVAWLSGLFVLVGLLGVRPRA